jgi:DNA-binding transcriptional ArsR family regulator
MIGMKPRKCGGCGAGAGWTIDAMILHQYIVFRRYTMKAPAMPAARPQSPSAPDTDEELAALARALGHPARVRILRLVAAREGCIGCDIVEDLELAQSTVSEHLRILRDAGLIEGRIERPRVCYAISRPGLARLKALVAAL